MKLTTPLDANRNELRQVRSENLAAAPSTPVVGQRYFDTALKVERVWDGTKWTDLTDVWVGPSAPAGTPATGDLWYDTDDVSTLVLPLAVTDGGTGQVTVPAARSALAVPAIGNSTTTTGGPTTGTWARGDQWLDSANVVWTCVTGGTPGTWMPPIGYEWAYNQVTAAINITSTSAASPNLIVEGTSRSYDGSAILVEFNCHVAATNAASSQLLFSLWDAGADTGLIGMAYAGGGQTNMPIRVTRRIVPTPGTHNYRIVAHTPVGGGIAYGGVGGAGAWNPMFVQVKRA